MQKNSSASPAFRVINKTGANIFYTHELMTTEKKEASSRLQIRAETRVKKNKKQQQ